MLRLLTDSRCHLDPATVATIPAITILAMNEALDIRDELEVLAARGDD